MPGLSVTVCTLVAAALAALAGVTAQAQVYRWIDERGVVNYATAVPAGVRATRIETGAARSNSAPAPATGNPRLPAVPRPAASTPPGEVDRATLDALGRALDARRTHATRHRGVAPEHHAYAPGSLPVAP
jgi:Domain of unknown function (DUF4124)